MNPELIKALKQAVSFEKNGKAIYEEVASKTKNPLIAKTFKYLAEQEDFHLQEIQNYLLFGRIEFLGDQPLVRIHRLVASRGQTRLVLRLFVFARHRILCVATLALELAGRLLCRLDGGRCERFEQLQRHRAVDADDTDTDAGAVGFLEKA